jgi:hypothetical protein
MILSALASSRGSDIVMSLCRVAFPRHKGLESSCVQRQMTLCNVVTFESSTLANVPQFAQATGLPDYVHNTTVDFGGVQAKFVRLTINSNWAGGTTLASLSEVRFLYILNDTAAKP